MPCDTDTENTKIPVLFKGQPITGMVEVGRVFSLFSLGHLRACYWLLAMCALVEGDACGLGLLLIVCLQCRAWLRERLRLRAPGREYRPCTLAGRYRRYPHHECLADTPRTQSRLCRSNLPPRVPRALLYFPTLGRMLEFGLEQRRRTL